MTQDNFYHRPVLLKESLDLLGVRPGGIYVDATLGGGGHAAQILERSAPDGLVIGLDRDPEAIAEASKLKDRFGPRIHLIQSNFERLREAVAGLGRPEVDGVLFDLGISSAQIDRSERGFSFQSEGPLDMRMEKEGPTAADLINGSDEKFLAETIRQYGQERMARAIARAIIGRRRQGRLGTTGDLARAVLDTRPAFPQKTLARVFQALRIAVNQELKSLPLALEAARDILKSGGRMVVISYHSLEDSLVKDFFRRNQNPCRCDPELGICVCGARPSLRLITKKPVVPTDEEIEQNPRARSARMRAAEKI